MKRGNLSRAVTSSAMNLALTKIFGILSQSRLSRWQRSLIPFRIRLGPESANGHLEDEEGGRGGCQLRQASKS